MAAETLKVELLVHSAIRQAKLAPWDEDWKSKDCQQTFNKQAIHPIHLSNSQVQNITWTNFTVLCVFGIFGSDVQDALS